MFIQEKNKPTLGLIFTRGISLQIWEKVGNLSREIKPYIELAKSFEEIYFFTYGNKKELEYQHLLPENIKIIPKPVYIPSGLYVFLMPIVRHRLFKKLNIIKTNQMDGSWAGVIGKILFGKKLVVRCGYEWLDFVIKGNRGWLKILIAKTVERISYRFADTIFITSSTDKEFIADTFSIAPEKIVVVPNYIDIDRFKTSPDTKRESGRIIFVGRLEPQKNIAALVESLEGLPAHLVIAGTGSLKASAIAASEKTGVSIEFLGNISQDVLLVELAKSEIYVLPSLYEGNPKSLLEAMACGLAVVGADAKGINNVIRDGESGLLAQGTPAGLHAKIKLLLESKDLRDRLGANARRQIIENQSLQVIVQKELNIYEKLL